MGKRTAIELARRCKDYIAGIFLLSIWLLGGMPAIKKEGIAMKQTPLLLNMSYDEKKMSTDGPIYNLARKAVDVIPADGTVYFFNPVAGGAGSYYSYKVKYYLYPRQVSVVDPGKEVKMEELGKGGYLMFYIPEGSLMPDIEHAVNNLPFSKKVYQNTDKSGGYQAIYAVGGEGKR
ncbi:MAG: hypothetical protein HY883_06215 [Deltaproteobacteria bacterium]|nr:hypothetical protein [Deltaproteobacteria bacterium]